MSAMAQAVTSFIHSLPLFSAFRESLARRMEEVTLVWATSAIVIALVGCYIVLNVLEIGTPEGVRKIPKISSIRFMLESFFNRDTVKTYKRVLRETLEDYGIVRVLSFWLKA